MHARKFKSPVAQVEKLLLVGPFAKIAEQYDDLTR